MDPLLSTVGRMQREDDDIQKDIRDLTREFRKLINELKKELDSRYKDVDAVHDTLLNLPPRLDNIYSSALDKKFHSLEKCSSHKEMFSKLNDCWNFLDFEVLQRVIEEHGSDQLISDMNEYLQSLHLFRTGTTVYQLNKLSKELTYRPSAVPERYKTYVGELYKDPRDCTLEELECIRLETRYSIQEAPLSMAALILYEVFDNSVIVVWLVEEQEVGKLSESVKRLIATDSGFIDRYDIIFLLLDDYMFYPFDCSQQVRGRVYRPWQINECTFQF